MILSQSPNSLVILDILVYWAQEIRKVERRRITRKNACCPLPHSSRAHFNNVWLLTLVIVSRPPHMIPETSKNTYARNGNTRTESSLKLKSASSPSSYPFLNCYSRHLAHIYQDYWWYQVLTVMFRYWKRHITAEIHKALVSLFEASARVWRLRWLFSSEPFYVSVSSVHVQRNGLKIEKFFPSFRYCTLNLYR